MDSDPYSLENLRGIVIPDPPPFWPPAPGMWIALGVVVLLLLLAAWRWHTNRSRTAYRRAGLRLLGEAKTAHDVSVVMKRVALAAFPREQVASLYGDDWAAFLHKTCPGGDFVAVIREDAGAVVSDTLVDLAGTWIRLHRRRGDQNPVAAN